MEPAEIFRRNVSKEIERRGLSQTKVADAINDTPQRLNDYLKGRINWGETKRLKLAKYLNIYYHRLYDPGFPAVTTQTNENQNAEKLVGPAPFPRYMEVMALPVPKRPWAIKVVAAEANGIHGWTESSGMPLPDGSVKIPPEHRRYFDGEITEVDLFEQYDRLFKRLVEKMDKQIEAEGL